MYSHSVRIFIIKYSTAQIEASALTCFKRVQQKFVNAFQKLFWLPST